MCTERYGVNRPAIFLDIDGVLVTPVSYDVRNNSPLPGFDPSCVNALNWLTYEADADLVISSSWRRIPTIASLLRARNIAAPVIGQTPDLGDAGRDHEIMAWLAEHGARPFIILDDDAQDLARLAPFLVQTDWQHGLMYRHAEQAVGMLKDQKVL